MGRTATEDALQAVERRPKRPRPGHPGRPRVSCAMELLHIGHRLLGIASSQENQMIPLDELLRSMTFDFFGSGKHKVELDTLLRTEGAVFLDVRSRQEWESLQITLKHHIRVLWIPIDEIPARHNEIPRDVLVGVFCSAGTRSSMVYMYLRSLGYENVRLLPGSYDPIISQVLPGVLYKTISSRNTGSGRGQM